MSSSSSLPLIPELLRLICEQSEKPSLAALARTCKSFEKPALDVLWFDLDDFYNLALCIPEQCLAETMIEVHERYITYLMHDGIPVVSETITRLCTYAERIRHITFHGTSHRQRRVGTSILQVLQIASHGSTLFPNLTRLTWICSERSNIPFIPLLLGPRLTEVRFTFGSTSSIFQQTAILPMLSRNYPLLKEVFFLHEIPPDAENIEDITKSIEIMSSSFLTWDRLESVTVSRISYAALRGLSLQSSLKRLEIYNWKSDAPSSGPQRGGFPALEHLLMSTTASHAILILELMESTPLRRIVIGTQDAEDTYAWKNVFAMVGQHCDRDTLREFLCTTGVDIRSQPEIPHGEMFSFDTIKPLLVFQNLTRLHLETLHGVYLDDSEATKEMAENWKSLTTLKFPLPSGYRPQRTSTITLLDLLPFAMHCSKLKRLTMVIDARNPPDINDKEHPLNSVCQNALSEINFESSPAKDPTRIAAFLSRCFPSLKKVIANNYQDTPDMEDSYEIWKQVENTLSDFKSMRLQDQAVPVGRALPLA